MTGFNSAYMITTRSGTALPEINPRFNKRPHSELIPEVINIELPTSSIMTKDMSQSKDDPIIAMNQLDNPDKQDHDKVSRSQL